MSNFFWIFLQTKQLEVSRLSKHYKNNTIKQLIKSLDEITLVTYNTETMKLEIPQAKEGSISIVGSNAIPVINLAKKVNKPLLTKGLLH